MMTWRCSAGGACPDERPCDQVLWVRYLIAALTLVLLRPAARLRGRRQLVRGRGAAIRRDGAGVLSQVPSTPTDAVGCCAICRLRLGSRHQPRPCRQGRSNPSVAGCGAENHLLPEVGAATHHRLASGKSLYEGGRRSRSSEHSLVTSRQFSHKRVFSDTRAMMRARCRIRNELLLMQGELRDLARLEFHELSIPLQTFPRGVFPTNWLGQASKTSQDCFCDEKRPQDRPGGRSSSIPEAAFIEETVEIGRVFTPRIHQVAAADLTGGLLEMIQDLVVQDREQPGLQRRTPGKAARISSRPAALPGPCPQLRPRRGAGSCAKRSMSRRVFSRAGSRQSIVCSLGLGSIIHAASSARASRFGVGSGQALLGKAAGMNRRA